MRVKGRSGEGVGSIGDEHETGDFDGFDEGGDCVLLFVTIDKSFGTEVEGKGRGEEGTRGEGMTD